MNENLASEKINYSLNALIGMFSRNCGMNSGHSSYSSCDEGLGDSPTSSINRLAPTADDPYHLMLANIWDDLDTSASQLDKTIQPSSIGV